MSRVDDLLTAALKSVPAKPPESARQPDKKRYSELLSQAIAPAFAEELRQRGMQGARPAPPGGPAGLSGAERRLAGGIGAKKVDVTWATEEAGLLLGISVKTISWRDSKTKNFQKNLTNRRGDMLIEAVTLHRRFPYAVLGGFFFLDWEAQSDSTENRRSTFVNAHQRMRMFTGRDDPAGRDEQWERLYVIALDANPFKPRWVLREVGKPNDQLELEQAFDELITLVAQRNFDFYDVQDGSIIGVSNRPQEAAKGRTRRGAAAADDSTDEGPSLDDLLAADDNTG